MAHNMTIFNVDIQVIVVNRPAQDRNILVSIYAATFAVYANSVAVNLAMLQRGQISAMPERHAEVKPLNDTAA